MPIGLSAVDWAVVGLYFGFVALIAFHVGRGQTSTRDFFLGGRSLPWWAATLSIVATETSAVTFMGVPRAAYERDWSFLQLVLGFVLGRIFLASFFVRVFYRRDFETVYAYLGERYGAWVGFLASVFFLAGRVVASGVRLYAGCLALQVATGAGSEMLIVSVAILGLLGTAFSFVGGIRSVIWTDVVLGVTFAASGIGAALYLAMSLPQGIGGLLSLPDLGEKLTVLDLGLDLRDDGTLLAGLLGGFVLTLATHGTDQDVAQRMLTCRDARGGSLSVLGSAVLIVPLMMLFLAIGTLLHYFYAAQGPAEPLPEDLNHLFPVFIVRELPRGFSGLAMAGLLAASLSSLTSVLNALASTTIADFYRPLWRRLTRSSATSDSAADERHFVRASRAVTLLWGGILVVAALLFVNSRGNVLVVALQALTYFYGAHLGTFLLAIFTRRGSALSVTVGMLVSVPAVLLLQARAFLARPLSAPSAVRALLEELPEGVRQTILDSVPEIAWPYWIIVGTAISFAIGALGSRRWVVK